MMGLLIIGVLVFIASFVIASPNFKYSSLAGRVRNVSYLILGVGALSSSIVQIDSGMVGVGTLFGKVQDGVFESGLNFVNPLMRITEFNVKTQNYTMSAVHDEGDKNGDDAIRVLSSDGLEVIIDLTVLFRIESQKAPLILQNIGLNYKNSVVRPITRTRIRDNAVYYDAISLYSTKRDEFQGRIFKTIAADFSARGLVLEQLLVRNINLPSSVKQTIESKINAEQEAQKMQFVLQKEKQEAERKRVEAQGIADYQFIVSKGLTDKQLQYESIKAQKEIATSSNTKIIIMGNKTNTPILITDK